MEKNKMKESKCFVRGELTIVCKCGGFFGEISDGSVPIYIPTYLECGNCHTLYEINCEEITFKKDL